MLFAVSAQDRRSLGVGVAHPEAVSCRRCPMLDPWIIEEIRKREDQDRRDDQPVLEIPLGDEPESDQEVREEDEGVERGVVIVDFRV